MIEFMVVILQQSTFKEKPEEPRLFEETLFLVRAASEEEAEKKVVDSLELPLEYPNQYGETVVWSFVKVVEVYEVHSEVEEHPREVFHRLFASLSAYEEVAGWMPEDD